MPQNALLYLFSLIRPYKRDIGITLIAVVTTASVILMAGYGLRHLVDYGFSIESLPMVNASAMVMVILAIILAVSAYVRTSTTAMLSEKVTNDLRKTVFQHVVYIQQSVYERQNSGDILSVLSADIEQIRQFISGSAATAIRTALQIVGASMLLVIQSPKLAVYLFLGLPVIFLPIILFGRKVKLLSAEVQGKEGVALALAKERLTDLMTLKSFQIEAQSCQAFASALDCKMDIAQSRTRFRSLVISLVIVLVFAGIAGILWVGAHEVIDDRLTPGQLSAFVFYAIIVAGSVNNFTDVFSSYTQALGAISRLENIFALPQDEIVSTHDAKPIQQTPFSKLDMKHVAFSYPQRPDQILFTDLNLSLKQGETVALVGHSGVGKSTIFKLLLGLYEPKAGEISLNDKRISGSQIVNLRHLFSLVPQDPIIYHMSIRDNIAIANGLATDTQLNDVIAIAHVDEFSSRFEEGLDTIVGDRGVRLSGGQRQRIALARALLRDAPILLLDEATNALDSQSEEHIQAAMHDILKTKSAMIIAHRLSTVKEADRIIYIGRGGVIASGSHAELLKHSEEYANLAKQQLMT